MVDDEEVSLHPLTYRSFLNTPRSAVDPKRCASRQRSACRHVDLPMWAASIDLAAKPFIADSPDGYV